MSYTLILTYVLVLVIIVVDVMGIVYLYALTIQQYHILIWKIRDEMIPLRFRNMDAYYKLLVLIGKIYLILLNV